MNFTSFSLFGRRPKRDPWADVSTSTDVEFNHLRRLLRITLAAGFFAFIAFSGQFQNAIRSDISVLQKPPSEESPEYQALIAAEPLPNVAPVQLPELPADKARAINAAVPFVLGPLPAAYPFVSQLSGVDRARATDCLAAAMWFEAGTDWEGQRAVAQVVLNRVRHPAFPNSICGVVFQGSERMTGCQFSFTCDGSMQRRPSEQIWQRTRLQAQATLNGSVFSRVGLATHYHTDWVAPYWSGSLDKIAAVRTHLFFRWKGGWGRPLAFASHPASQEPTISKLAALSYAHAKDGSMPLEQRLEPASDGAAPGVLTLARERDLPAINALPALRGATVKLVHPEGDAFALLLNPTIPPGAYALAALDLCKGKGFCKVMGWRDAARIPRGFPIAADANQSMTFVYLRQNGQEYQRWNCAQIPNPPGRQCRNPATDSWDRLIG